VVAGGALVALLEDVTKAKPQEKPRTVLPLLIQSPYPEVAKAPVQESELRFQFPGCVPGQIVIDSGTQFLIAHETMVRGLPQEYQNQKTYIYGTHHNAFYRVYHKVPIKIFGLGSFIVDVYVNDGGDTEDDLPLTDNVIPLTTFLPFYDVTIWRAQDGHNYIAFEQKSLRGRGTFVPYSTNIKERFLKTGTTYIKAGIGSQTVEFLFDSGTGGFGFINTKTARRIDITKYPMKPSSSATSASKPDPSTINVGQVYTVPINFGGLIVHHDIIIHNEDGFPGDGLIAVQELYKKGLGVTYRGDGIDIFQV
jgi:hypothetical protein